MMYTGKPRMGLQIYDRAADDVDVGLRHYGLQILGFSCPRPIVQAENAEKSAMAFKLNISPEIRARVDAESAEMVRLFNLEDRWLANELLRLTRKIRDLTPFAVRDPRGDTWNSSLLWDLIPELAYRLGGKLQLNESADFDLRRADGAELRLLVSHYLQNVATTYFRDAQQGELLDPVNVLFHNFWNGNPIAMALDRLAPPADDSVDHLATELLAMSRRRGHAATGAWHPGLQGPATAPQPEPEFT